jgi:hypothetical protein
MSRGIYEIFTCMVKGRAIPLRHAFKHDMELVKVKQAPQINTRQRSWTEV